MSREISSRFAVLFGLRYMLDRVGNDPCDECDIDALLGLPEGLTYVRGAIRFECLSCGDLDEWPAEVEDFDIDNPANRCGKSPGCCP